jgi:hypothetical protein
MLKLYDCDVGITLRGVNYEFEHVDSVSIEDPERTRLIRGGNAKNKLGIAYTEGVKDAKTVTTSVIGIPAALHVLLTDAFNTKERLDFWAISRQDGSSKMAKNAVLSQKPMQPTLDDSAESLNTPLVFESFDVTELLKS